MSCQKDPLQITLILEKVFEHLPIAGRKNFRLVNKLWRDVTVDKWRRSTKVWIIHESFIEEFVMRMTNRNPVPTAEVRERSGAAAFYKLFKKGGSSSSVSYENGVKLEPFFNLLDHPFRNFFMMDDDIIIPPYKVPSNDTDIVTVNGCDDKANILAFFETCGPSMESLEMKFCPGFRQGRLLEALKWLLLKCCTNLTKLSIQCDDFFEDVDPNQPSIKDEECSQTTAISLLSLDIQADNLSAEMIREMSEEIFTLAPNLQHLKVDWNGMLILAGLKNPLPNGTYIQLKSLEIEEPDFPVLREYLETAKPPLTKLKFYMSMSEVSAPPISFHFHSFLADYKATLTRLNLTFEWFSNCEFQWFSILTGHHFPNLVKLLLNLKIIMGQCDPWIPVKLDFRVFGGLPKLKVFRCVTNQNQPGMEMERGGLSPNELLSHLNPVWIDEGISHSYFLSPSFILRDLHEFYYNLSEKLNQESLKSVASWMPSIKRLALIADNETFPLIMELWHLEKIVLLYGSSVNEDLITREEANRPIIILRGLPRNYEL